MQFAGENLREWLANLSHNVTGQSTKPIGLASALQQEDIPKTSGSIDYVPDGPGERPETDLGDEYLDGKIKKSVQKYEDNKKYVGIVYSDAIIENLNKGTKIHEFREPFSRDALERECIISNTPLVSKEAIKSCGMYDEEMRTCEDWDLWLRITETFVAIHLPEPLHVYSVTGRNSSDTVDKEVWQSNWQKIRQRLLHRANASI